MPQTNATLKTTVEPTTEPLTVAELKEVLRISNCDFDAEIGRILVAARRKVEYETRRRLITQTVALYLDTWPAGDTIELRISPVSAVTSIAYVDTDDQSQTLATSVYQTDFDHTPPRVVLKEAQQWPSLADQTVKAVTVTMTAGYGAASAVPAEAKMAITELARGMWAGCEDAVKGGSTYKNLIEYMSWTAYAKVI